jgi:hypothetical protein
MCTKDYCLSPGLVGLAISYGLSMEGCCISWITYWQTLENAMVAPERINQYQIIEPEADLETPGGVQVPAIHFIIMQTFIIHMRVCAYVYIYIYTYIYIHNACRCTHRVYM